MATNAELARDIKAPNTGYAIARVSNEWEQTWAAGATTLLVDVSLFSSLWFHLPAEFNNDEILVKVTNSDALNPKTIETIASYTTGTWTQVSTDDSFGATHIQLVTDAAAGADATCSFMAQG